MKQHDDGTNARLYPAPMPRRTRRTAPNAMATAHYWHGRAVARFARREALVLFNRPALAPLFVGGDYEMEF